MRGFECVTGNTANPTEIVRRFSPVSNDYAAKLKPGEGLRVLVATDVLSEGQNLQDCHIVINYDLPWAIIRLVQRVGRVDRIGQTSPEICCYSFIPADGIEAVIHLREKLMARLRQNSELLGTDEAFFEDEDVRKVVDLYHEKAGTLDDDSDGEVDLTSYAFRIWRDATKDDRDLKREVLALPEVVYSTRKLAAGEAGPEGVLVYIRTATGNDVLARVDDCGLIINQSQLAILKTAECEPDAPAQPRLAYHHERVYDAVAQIASDIKEAGGELGPPRGARRRIYDRMLDYALKLRGKEPEEVTALNDALTLISNYPLREYAARSLNKAMREHETDAELSAQVRRLYFENRLCQADEPVVQQDAQIICSLGLC